ncbi:MAG: nitroreductase family protein, partial [Oscillospiraceae bacterium]
MELKEAMYNRRSVRKYTTEPVSDADLDLLLHYAMSGPSACNRKPWEFYVVRSETVKDELRRVGRFTNRAAPVILVIAGDIERALPAPISDYWVQDCSAAVENILLGAVSIGLGTCWCGIHPDAAYVEKVQGILGLEKHVVPLGLIHLGHPDEFPESRDQYDAS